MTDTELIAVKLFGWFLTSDGDCYVHGPTGSLRFASDGMSWPDEWPDLTDWNDIRRMEDALGLDNGRYLDALAKIVDPDYDPKRWEDPQAAAARILRATAPQRIAAAVRVIREAGL